MSDKTPNPPAPTPDSGESRLTVANLAQRLGDYQTVFIERMQKVHEYIEGIEDRHAQEIIAHQKRISALEDQNKGQQEVITDLTNRLKSAERGLSTVIRKSNG
jgi:hypothetical protein